MTYTVVVHCNRYRCAAEVKGANNRPPHLVRAKAKAFGWLVEADQREGQRGRLDYCPEHVEYGNAIVVEQHAQQDLWDRAVGRKAPR